MKKNILIFILFIILFLAWQCSPIQKKQNAVYFYNNNSIFKVYDNEIDSTAQSHLIFYKIRGKTIDKYIYDTILIGRIHKSYNFLHTVAKDTVFVKPKAYLNKIEYFDTKWLKDESNLDSFWASIKPWEGYPNDKQAIFLIEPYNNTDSLIFRRVHRFYITR